MSSPAELTAFVRVVEKGSFVAAADDLGLTASAVSKLISRVEARLGVALLTRTTRRLALTEEGEIYVRRAREILAAIEAADAEVAASGARLKGRIRVNSGTAIGRHQLAPLVGPFRARYPDITLDLGITDRQIDPVAENVDVVLRTGALGDSSMIARKIAESQRVICASPAYLDKHGTPRRPSDLLDHDCLVLPGFADLADWPFHTPEGINRLAVKGPVTADSADVLLDLALAGQGIVRLAEIIVAAPVREGLLVPLLTRESANEPVPVWALTPPGRNRVPRVRALLDFLVESLGKVPWRLDLA